MIMNQQGIPRITVFEEEKYGILHFCSHKTNEFTPNIDMWGI